MNFPLRSMLALAITAALPAIAQAANIDEPWYAGAKVGASDFSSQDYLPGLESGDRKGSDKAGAGAFVGYQFNDWFALEGGYDHLGKDGLKESLSGTEGKVRFQGLQLSGKFSTPIADKLDAYARVGVMGYRASGSSGKHSGAAPLAALGLDYTINRDWSTRVEYQYTHDLGKVEESGMSANNGLLSVGVAYHFGGAPAVVPVAEPVVEPAPVEQQVTEFKLQGDVLFAFDSAELSEAGRAELTRTAQQIKAAQPQQAAVNVAGYTDHMGSDAYNLKLSKARAASVGNFLVSLGFPTEIISTEGFGEADPVAGCDDVKPRAELIKCLAPNRRVVIRVHGVAAQQPAQPA